jgi:hypothetical protein
MSNKRYIVGATAIAAVLFVLLFSPLSAQVRQPFEWIIAKRLTVNTIADIGGATTIGGALTGAAAQFTGNVQVDGVLTGNDDFYLVPGTSITVADGGTITATTAVQELTAAGAVGAALGACADGQVLSLVNIVNQTITITDTGTTRLTANAALGQWDTLTVIGNGTACIEVARANN